MEVAWYQIIRKSISSCNPRLSSNQRKTRMTIHFSTTEFECSHGRKPRGYGYWGFFFGVTKNVWFAPNVCDFAAAKRVAREEAKRRNCDEVSVAP